MKKLAILFLLTTVLFSFAFGQISEKMTLEFGNVTKPGDTEMSTNLKFTTEAAGSKELGPGTLGIYAEFVLGQSFTKISDESVDLPLLEDLEVKPSYTLAAGPGNLQIYVDWYYGGFNIAEVLSGGGTEGFGFRVAPGVDYTGIDLGMVKLGFGVELRYGYLSSAEISGSKIFENGLDDLVAKLTAGFDFGLNITYKFMYNLGAEKGWKNDKQKITNIAYLDVSYQILDNLVGGVELDDTAKHYTDGTDKKDALFNGFTLKPYVDFKLDDNLSFGAYFKVAKLGATEKVWGAGKGDKDMQLTPGVWVKYTL